MCFWEWKSKENSCGHRRDPEAGGRAVWSRLCCRLTARPWVDPSLPWTSCSFLYQGEGGQLTSVFCCLTDSLTDSGKDYLVCLFVIAALRYSLYATQFTHLKGTIQKNFKKKNKRYNSRFSVHSWSCATIAITSLGTFSSSPEEGPCSPGIAS